MDMNIGNYAVPSKFTQLITILDSINEVTFSKPGRHTDYLDRLMVILLSHSEWVSRWYIRFDHKNFFTYLLLFIMH